MSQEFFEHQICYVTARVLVQLPGDRVSIGTGFIYKRPVPNFPDRSAILLISNKHVFHDSKGKLQISLNAITSEGKPDYGNTQHFEQDDFSSIYFPHPDAEVDLACVNISSIDGYSVYYKNLHDTFLQEIKYDSIPPGSDVIFVGYPENRFDTKNNLPLIRKGSIASVPQVEFNGRSQIVIDAQVFQGSSGSPVFASIDGYYKLLGVVSETMIRHSQLQTVPAAHSILGVQQILGLGIVIKQSKVVELIDRTMNLISDDLAHRKYI